MERAMVRKVFRQIIIIRQAVNIQIIVAKKVFKVEYYKFLIIFVAVINKIWTKAEDLLLIRLPNKKTLKR